MSRQLKLAVTRPYLPFWVVMLVLTLLVKEHVFFWDTIQLGSKHGHWYYDNAFAHFLLPPEIDSGHIPAFGMYIALCWSLFGKSLLVSHLAMLPFLFGCFYYCYRIGQFLVGEKASVFLLFLLLVDPVFAGQAILVSPDIALLCFFLLALAGILQDNSPLKWIGLTVLPLVSMRGMMVVFGLFLFEMLRARPWTKQKGKFTQLIKLGLQKLPWYLPGGIIALAFLGYHYAQTGWIGYHPDSPWAASYARVDAAGALRNVAILGWRFLDYGRLFLWAGLGIGGILVFAKKQQLSAKLLDTAALFVILLVVLGIPMVTHKAIMAHRYLLPVFFVLSLLFFQLWYDCLAGYQKWKSVAFVLTFLGLLTGNLWVYPKKVAQGWDSTLAHWPHYQLRSEMISYIKEQDIAFDSIGTAFPEIGPFRFKDLSDDNRGFAPKNLPEQSYILYANTMNDFTDAEIDELETKWKVVHSIDRGGVCFILYSK